MAELPWHVWLAAFGDLLAHLAILPPPDSEQTQQALKIERECCVAGLTAIATFISTFDKQHGHRFFDLAQKISDLNKGQRASLLEPARVWDRHPDPSHRWMARARAVLAIEALTRTGTKPGIAAQRVANQNPDLRKFAGPRAAATPMDKVLLHWRKEFQARRVKNMEATVLYAEGTQRIEKWLAAGRRGDVLAIAKNVYEANKGGGVLSPPSHTRK